MYTVFRPLEIGENGEKSLQKSLLILSVQLGTTRVLTDEKVMKMEKIAPNIRKNTLENTIVLSVETGHVYALKSYFFVFNEV